VRFTIVVEFLVNLYVFPFLIELVLVPIIVLFAGMQVVAAAEPAHASARRAIDGALIALGLLLLTYAAVEAIRDPSALFTRENAETLLVAPALTFAFVLLLWAWARISRREQENLRKRFSASYDSPA
jgi:cytochrome bd-type quinol oxidase subunit 2